jgi:hypothetical protein
LIEVKTGESVNEPKLRRFFRPAAPGADPPGAGPGRQWSRFHPIFAIKL